MRAGERAPPAGHLVRSSFGPLAGRPRVRRPGPPGASAALRARVREPSRPIDRTRIKKAPLTVANIKSQIKRIRTNEKARLRNQSVKSELKTYVRRVREAIDAGDKAAAEEQFILIQENGILMW